MPKKQVTASNDILHDFGLWTSAHGYRRIILSDSLPGKIMWGIVTGICTIVFLVQCVKILNWYLDYPTSVTTHREEESPDFPVVTVCNMNPIRRSKASGNLAQFAVLPYVVSPQNGWENLYDLTAPPPAVNVATTEATVELTTNSTNNDTSFVSRKKRAAEELRRDRTEFVEAVSTWSTSARNAAEHQKSDMILSCTFGGTHCDRDGDFEYFYHARYGACYVFNLGQNASKVLVQPGIGPATGFQLILNAELDEYLDNIPEVEGMRVAIHQARTRPPMEEQGFTIPPLTSTAVNMRMKYVDRPGDPYVTCKDPDEPKKKTRFSALQDNDPYAFSVSECMSNCAQELIYYSCECVTDAAIAPGEPLCGTGKEECIENIISHVKHSCGTQCPPPCRDKVYTYTISESGWPAQHYWDSVVETVRGLSDKVDDDIANGLITRNILQLKVYFGDVGYDSHEEEESYTLFNVLADVGGISALFIGWSVLTIAEFIELAVLLCTYKFCGYETERGAPVKKHMVKEAPKIPPKSTNEDSLAPSPSYRAAQPLQPVHPPAQPLDPVPGLTLADRMKATRMQQEY